MLLIIGKCHSRMTVVSLKEQQQHISDISARRCCTVSELCIQYVGGVWSRWIFDRSGPRMVITPKKDPPGFWSTILAERCWSCRWLTVDLRIYIFDAVRTWRDTDSFTGHRSRQHLEKAFATIFVVSPLITIVEHELLYVLPSPSSRLEWRASCRSRCAILSSSSKENEWSFSLSKSSCLWNRKCFLNATFHITPAI